ESCNNLPGYRSWVYRRMSYDKICGDIRTCAARRKKYHQRPTGDEILKHFPLSSQSRNTNRMRSDEPGEDARPPSQNLILPTRTDQTPAACQNRAVDTAPPRAYLPRSP